MKGRQMIGSRRQGRLEVLKRRRGGDTPGPVDRIRKITAPVRRTIERASDNKSMTISDLSRQSLEH